MFWLHITLKAHVACDLNIIVKGEGLLKVTGSHLHWKSVNIGNGANQRCFIKEPLTGSDIHIRPF